MTNLSLTIQDTRHTQAARKFMTLPNNVIAFAETVNLPTAFTAACAYEFGILLA